MGRTRRCSCRSCRTCRWVICAPSCRIPPRPATFPTPSCSGRWPMWRWAISSFGSTRCQDWAKVLSPGEQQRVAFARILLTKPKAVFLDEAHIGPRRRFGIPDVRDAANQVAQHHRRQRQPPPHRRTAPRASSGACSARASGGSAGWKATNRSPSNTFRVDVTAAGVTSRHGNVHAVPRLGQRDPHVGAVGGQSVGDQRDMHPDRADADRPVHHLGPAVLAGHRRLLQGPRKRSGVGVAGRAAAVGDGVGAHRRAVELSGQ